MLLQEGSAYTVSCMALRPAGIFPPFSLHLIGGALQFPVLLLVRSLTFLYSGTRGSRRLLDISLLRAATWHHMHRDSR
jgi:hypothetical protein